MEIKVETQRALLSEIGYHDNDYKCCKDCRSYNEEQDQGGSWYGECHLFKKHSWRIESKTIWQMR